MMKLRLFSRNSVRAALHSLIILSCFVFASCSSSTSPTYLKENIPDAIESICKSEYRLDVVSKLVGSTVWIYIPLEDLIVKADKPEKYLERFSIIRNDVGFQGQVFRLEYLIKLAAAQDKDKYQKYIYNKAATEKMSNVWLVLRRVLFSLDRSKKDEPKFFVIIAADIKKGMEIKEMFYYLDLKKLSYGFISWGEYQHRTIQDTDISPRIIGDTKGTHLKYKDVTMEEFLVDQMQHRVELKFQKPEVERNAEIDKEIMKVAVSTLKIYRFTDFSATEFHNLLTRNKIILNRAAALAKPTD